jgi:7,8-dihydroneopterin aldolase/epimerase/oxygenase
MKIGLKGAKFYAYHGYYPEENMMGCTFLIDASVTIANESFINENLGSTINYQAIYDIVSAEMKLTYQLLETLLLEIEKKVKAAFPAITECHIKIEKHTPHLGGPLLFTFVEEVFGY